MSQTFTTQSDLFGAIRHNLFLASQASPVLPVGAMASHVRVRSGSETQFAWFRKLANDSDIFYHAHLIEHKGKAIIFARLRGSFFGFNGNILQPVRWLEFTAPKPEHADGPDALVFKVADATEATEELVTANPDFRLRYQALSAEDITAK